MGIDIYLENLENCSVANCAELRRDILGYSSFLPLSFKVDEREVHIERLDSPGFAMKRYLTNLKAEIRTYFSERSYAVKYRFRRIPKAEKDLPGVFEVRYREYVKAEVTSVCSKSQYLRFLEQKRGRVAEKNSNKWKFVSRWDRLDYEEKTSKFCSTCRLKLPFDYRDNCDGWFSSYPRLPLMEAAVADALERVPLWDAFIANKAKAPDVIKNSIGMKNLEGIKRRWGLRLLREAIDRLVSFIPDEESKEKRIAELAFRLTVEALDSISEHMQVMNSDGERGKESVLKFEGMRKPDHLAEQILDFLIFRDRTFGPGEIELILPFAEVIWQLMRIAANAEPDYEYVVSTWLEFLISLRNAYKYKLRVRLAG